MEAKKENVEGWKIGNCCVEFKITRENMKEIKRRRKKIKKNKRNSRYTVYNNGKGSGIQL